MHMHMQYTRTEGYGTHGRCHDEEAHKVPLLGHGVWFDDVVAHRDERSVREERDEHEHQDGKLEERRKRCAMALSVLRERQAGRGGGGGRWVRFPAPACYVNFDMAAREHAQDRGNGEKEPPSRK